MATDKYEDTTNLEFEITDTEKKIIYDLNSLIARIHTFLLNVLQFRLVGYGVFGASVHLILSL
jgi:hypothetical protein